MGTTDHQRIGWHLFKEMTKHPYITVEKLKTIRDKLIATIDTGKAKKDPSEDEGSKIESDHNHPDIAATDPVSSDVDSIIGDVLNWWDEAFE